MAVLQTTEDFRKAIAYLQSVDYFGAVILQLNIGDTVAECEVLDDATLTDITPDTPTLESALDNANADIAANETIESAQSGLLDKVALAEQYADSIKTLYNAVLDQTENQTAQPNRFNALYAVVQAAPLAFRSRFVTDCTQELGFDVAGTLTLNQQRQTCLFIRVWVTGLALLLSVRRFA